MAISSQLETTFICRNCGIKLTLEEKNIKPKKLFGNELDNAKICLIRKAMHVGWLFETRDCTCPQCRSDKGRN